MHTRNLLFFVVFLFAVPLIAQQQVYHFRDLEHFLPEGNLDGYKPGKPTGETSSMMGFSTSWAQVIYTLDTGSVKSSISVKITDMLSIPAYLSVFGDIDKKTSTGYEKTVVYKTIRVLETYDGTTRNGKLQLPVARRFLVELTGAGIENTRPLYDLLDKMNLSGLAKLAHPQETP